MLFIVLLLQAELPLWAVITLAVLGSGSISSFVTHLATRNKSRLDVNQMQLNMVTAVTEQLEVVTAQLLRSNSMMISAVTALEGEKERADKLGAINAKLEQRLLVV